MREKTIFEEVIQQRAKLRRKRKLRDPICFCEHIYRSTLKDMDKIIKQLERLRDRVRRSGRNDFSLEETERAIDVFHELCKPLREAVDRNKQVVETLICDPLGGSGSYRH
jgi:hypothetical protein